MKVITFNILFLVFGVFAFLSFMSTAYSFDKFEISKKKCLKIGHKVGSRPYAECIITTLKEQRFREPDAKTLSAIKNYIDEGNGEYWAEAPGNILVGSALAVGTSLAIKGMVQSITPSPAPSPNTGGTVKFGYPIKPYYGQSSPNFVNPPGQFFIPVP